MRTPSNLHSWHRKVESRAPYADVLDVGNQTIRQTKPARLLVALAHAVTERGAQNSA